MSQKKKFNYGCLLPLLFIIAGLVVYLWPSGTGKAGKVRSLFSNNPSAPALEKAVYDETSMLDKNPYRPQYTPTEEKKSFKSRKAPFHYVRNRSKSKHSRPSTQTAGGLVQPSTATALAAPLVEEAAAAAGVAPAQRPGTETVAAKNVPVASPSAAVATPAAVSATGEMKPKPTPQEAAASAGPVLNQEVMSMFPGINNPKHQKQIKETDRLLQNLSKALQKAVSAPQQSKRMQNIAKYAKGGGGSSGRFGGNANAGGGSNAAEKSASNAIMSAGEEIAQNMEKNYGAAAGNQVRRATNQYAAAVNRALAIENEEKRRAALAAEEALYQQRIRNAQMEAIFKEALEEHKKKYIQELTEQFGAETAQKAAPLLEQYQQDIFDASYNPELEMEDLMKIESGFQNELEKMVNEQFLEDEDVQLRLQTVRENVLKNNLENLSVQLETQQASGNNLAMNMITEDYLADMRAEMQASNQTLITNMLNSEELASYTPQQRAYWEKEAKQILETMTDEMIFARKNTPPDQVEQYNALLIQIGDKANGALANISVPPTQEQSESLAEMKADHEAYFSYIRDMYGEEAGEQVRTLYLKMQKGLITPEEFEQQTNIIQEQNRETFERNQAELKEKYQKEAEKKIHNSCRSYERQILADKAVTQYPKRWQDLFKRMLRPEINKMEKALVALSREEIESEEEYKRRQDEIYDRTAENINILLAGLYEKYEEISQ